MTTSVRLAAPIWITGRLHLHHHLHAALPPISPNSVCALSTTRTTVQGQPVTFVPFNASTVISGDPQQWFNPLMFTPSQVGFLGTTSRNVLRGPHLSNFNVSFNKDTPAPFLGEAGVIQFRAEFFNIFNHANFGMPQTAAYGGSIVKTPTGGTVPPAFAEAPALDAGRITNTITTSRQIQLSLKVIF